MPASHRRGDDVRLSFHLAFRCQASIEYSVANANESRRKRHRLTRTTTLATAFFLVIAACRGGSSPTKERNDGHQTEPASNILAGGANPRNLKFVSVLEGGWQCGLEADKTMVCKGPQPKDCGNRFHDDGAGNCVANYVLVSTCGWHVCGVLSDNTVTCWGAGRSGDLSLSSKNRGQADSPAGSFVSVSSAESHVCGVKTDGAVTCWGATAEAAAKPPAGTFTSVSTARWHTCGVRLDATVACWGARPGFLNWSPSRPQAGSFDSVSTGACRHPRQPAVDQWCGGGNPAL